MLKLQKQKNDISNISIIVILFSITGCSVENSYDSFDSNISIFECDIIIEKENYEICYDYNYKGPKFVSYHLDGSFVNELNIEKRPSFYIEKTLAQEYISDYDDYIGSGYDRGHLANDASFDWNLSVLNSVYSMANISPQYPDVNRYAWSDTETLEREKAVEYEEVDVIIGVVYSDNPQRIGEHEIAVPEAFYKNISNEDKSYEECYYYENIPISDISADTLQEHIVSCDTLTLNYK